MAGDSTAPILFGEAGRYFWDVVDRTNKGVAMILVVLLVLALFFVQTLLPNRFREAPPSGAKETLAESLGNRDHQRPLTIVGGRAARALANLHEALPVFLALALMNMIATPGAAIAVTGAWVFLIARVVYVAIYLAGVPVVRTICWMAGLVGLAMMVAPLLDRI
jgi:uncharacterized MAPEG superfamily protein